MEEAIRKAGALVEALPYIQQFSGKPVVVKFGGSAMEHPNAFNDILEDVVFLSAVGVRPVIVHGGGRRISEGMDRRGLSPTFVHGHRVTDADTLEVALEVLQQVSREIVETIRGYGGRAECTFRDGTSRLRATRKMLETEDGPQDMGFVGDVTSVDGAAILSMAEAGKVPVTPPLGQDRQGQLYNINADSAAAAVAAELGAEKLVFLSDVHGILSDPDDPDSLLSTVDEDSVHDMIRRGVIAGGMLPKVRACLRVLDSGVRKAHIIDGRLPHSLLLEIFTNEGVGTQILR